VTSAGCKVAETLQTQNGMAEGYQVLTLIGVVPDPPGVEEVATGRFQLLRWNWGTPMPRYLVTTNLFPPQGDCPGERIVVC
jgi:hypothetical protein